MSMCVVEIQGSCTQNLKDASGKSMATLKNAFAGQKQAITAPGLALLTLRYQLKREGCLFVSVFFSRRFFRPRAAPLPPFPLRGCTEKSITQHFFPRVKHAPTRRACLCVWLTHTRAHCIGLPAFFPCVKICDVLPHAQVRFKLAWCGNVFFLIFSVFSLRCFFFKMPHQEMNCQKQTDY